MTRKAGFDLGSSSIGYAIREGEELIYNGVVTFESGMVKGTGGYSSPTKDRRMSRSKRNLSKSRKQRKTELLELLTINDCVPLTIGDVNQWRKYTKGKKQKFPENKKFLQWLACDFSYQNGSKYKNPYELRVALQQKQLSKHELGRALYHIIQRRGYKDIGESDKETDNQIKRRDEEGFSSALVQHKTISKALLYEFLEKNKRARNQYPYRAEYANEIEIILKHQGFDISKKDKQYNNEFVKAVFKAIIWQQPLKSQKGNIGKCSLEPSKNRSPISHPIFEIFRAWQFINTIQYFDANNEKQFLPQEIRNKLFINKFLTKDKNFKFQDLVSFLNKQFGKKLQYNYPISKKTGKYETPVAGMPICKDLISIIGDNAKKQILQLEQYNISNAPKVIDNYSVFDLWHSIFEFDEEYLNQKLNDKLQLERKAVKIKGKEHLKSPLVLLKQKLSKGYADLSIKAMRKIIPFLKDGFLYHNAVVLARIPENIGKEKWEELKEVILSTLKKSEEEYNKHKDYTNIVNNLIHTHKGLQYPNIFGTNIDYQLDNSDWGEIKEYCEKYFGKNTWQTKNQEDIIEIVGNYYQNYFKDSKRTYRRLTTKTDLFEQLLKEKNINLEGKIYHHSNRENLYAKNFEIDKETGEIGLPIDKQTGLELLPSPIIGGIKNPMFNKSMSILRKLVNELIKHQIIDEDTEITIEVARELNDNNKRKAIEQYQESRRKLRNKYREFLEEFSVNGHKKLNIEEAIPVFELWNEQLFSTITDEKGKRIPSNEYISKQKNAVDRYELWMEQKGICMYTGKPISISKLFSNDVDIEHTIPRSILPDDTMANKTIAFSIYNRDVKGKSLPTECENYNEDTQEGTAIVNRLEAWEKIRDNYKQKFENNRKPKGGEDEAKKNERIYFKHLYKMHYDYWKDKIERFTTTEVKDSWARRQLVDTQTISKYAREFLKTKFKKVAVQKGSVTAQFRKIYQFQSQDEIKNRSKHTHHAIDAYVLTLIPTNSNARDSILNKMYELAEETKKQLILKPFPNFNSQHIIETIENETLVFNYTKDKILQQTKKYLRKRGKLQKFINNNREEQTYIQKGTTIRTNLFAESYLGKIRNVELDKNNKPKRNGSKNDWIYKTGKEAFSFVKRVPIDEALKKIDEIVDPILRERIRTLKYKKQEITDFQGNRIRHIRIYVKAGRKVKERTNYRSEHDYKNHFYSEAGSIPYAIMVQTFNKGRIERNLISIPSFEIAKVFKKHKKFSVEFFLQEYQKEYSDILANGNNDIKLLKVGQRVLVLKNDNEIEGLTNQSQNFFKNRLYKITRFFDPGVYLQHHSLSNPNEVDNRVKELKDKILREYELKYKIPEIQENKNIINLAERKKDFENRKYKFSSLSNYRYQQLLLKTDIQIVTDIYKELKKYSTQNSKIEIEGETPLLKITDTNCNFLYEGYDFEFSLLGKITLKDE